MINRRKLLTTAVSLPATLSINSTVFGAINYFPEIISEKNRLNSEYFPRYEATEGVNYFLPGYMVDVLKNLEPSPDVFIMNTTGQLSYVLRVVSYRGDSVKSACAGLAKSIMELHAKSPLKYITDVPSLIVLGGSENELSHPYLSMIYIGIPIEQVEPANKGDDRWQETERGDANKLRDGSKKD